MKNKLLLLVLLFTLPLAAKAAEGLAGATVKHDGDRVTRMESCKADPESCRAARHARKEACRANPEKCRSDRRARREKWCAANPDNCKRVRARMEKCKANPGKCKAERKAKFDARFRRDQSRRGRDRYAETITSL
jgi:hypothetical protein